MAVVFLQIARQIGYEAVFFNLVFDDNESAKRLYLSLGFRAIGTARHTHTSRRCARRRLMILRVYWKLFTQA